jgi:3-oxoacyl-[acyl-carrier protein] reductase
MTTDFEWRGWKPGDPLLAGKVALVAGGGRGIGEATTRALSGAGAAVAVIDIEADRAESVAASLRDNGAEAQAFVVNLREEDASTQVVDTVAEQFGRLDVLANVAGGTQGSPWQHVSRTTTEDWDAVVHMNLRYVFWLSRAAIPHMERGGGGSIVSVASISGMFGSPNHAAYGAAKAGIIQLMQTIATETGRLGIRANAVSPGAIVTPATAGTMSQERQDTLTRATPLQRPGRPEDIARAVLFFASPMSEYITGQVLLVDGGVGAKFPFGGTGTHPSEAALATGDFGS